MDIPVAVLDACVLYPAPRKSFKNPPKPLQDFLGTLSAAGLVETVDKLRKLFA